MKKQRVTPRARISRLARPRGATAHHGIGPVAAPRKRWNGSAENQRIFDLIANRSMKLRNQGIAAPLPPHPARRQGRCPDSQPHGGAIALRTPIGMRRRALRKTASARNGSVAAKSGRCRTMLPARRRRPRARDGDREASPTDPSPAPHPEEGPLGRVSKDGSGADGSSGAEDAPPRHEQPAEVSTLAYTIASNAAIRRGVRGLQEHG